MYTIYWVPGPNDQLPRFMAFDEDGRRKLFHGFAVEGVPGALKYEVPETTKNKQFYETMSGVWQKEPPKSGNQIKTSQKSILKSGASSVEDPHKTPLTRAELIVILENNGIAFRGNQKTETLYEKLPDDIARNFKLAESSAEVQT